MADNNQGFWNYMREEGIKNNPVVNAIRSPINLFFGQEDENTKRNEAAWSWLLRWINNTISNRDWWDDNTTFEQAMAWQIYANNPTKDSFSISVSSPQNTATLNDVAKQDVANWWIDITKVTTSNTTPSQTWWAAIDENIAPTSDTFVDITKLEVEDLAKNHQKEEEIEDEAWYQTAWRWAKWKYNEIADNRLADSLEAQRQSMEQHMILSYDPDSKDVTELVFNTPQWLSDDFWATLYSRGENNEEIFNSLYAEYMASLQMVVYSDLPWEDKQKASDMLFEEFRKEVNDRKLLKAFENDHYMDGKFTMALAWDDTKFNWRLKNKFTQEQLDAYAGKKVEEWAYEVSPEEFDNFLKMYEYNRWLSEDMSLGAYYWNSEKPDKSNITYTLTQETASQMQYVQATEILEPARVKLVGMIDEWKIAPDKANKIENLLISVTNDYVSNMHFWLDTPLALYVSVKNKNPWDMTNWERAVLAYWPWIQKLMEDYVSAVQKWVLATLDTVDSEWNIHAPDMIDWMSVNDFFRNAIEESNIQAWWWDLYASESAIDAFQLINNNISYLYYSWKWNWLRQWWQEWQRALWAIWYSAWELTQLWFNWILQWADYLVWLTWNKSDIADYMLADNTRWLKVKNDIPEFWRLVSNFWLWLMENGPEFLWEFAAFKFAFPENLFKLKMLRSWATTAEKLREGTAARQKLWLIQRWIWALRKSINFPAQKDWRGWLLRMINWWLKSLEWNNQITNNIIKIWQNIAKWAVSDQLIDWLVSYYDTEAYSDLSFLLSVWLTWLTEITAPLVKDSQIFKKVWNFLNWRERTQWTAWRVMSYLNTDENALKRLELIFWKNNVPLEALKAIWEHWWEYEDVMEQALNMLPKSVYDGINKFSKQALFEQLRKLNYVDWDSPFWRQIISLINNRWTNVADMAKLMFWLPWKVQLWWFISNILLKNPWQPLQTRLLKKDYDIQLDFLEWGFRKRLKDWFTIDELKQIQKHTKFKDLVKWWAPDNALFQKEWDKYFLTMDWAKKFELDVSEYTDSMRRADLRREAESETKEILDEKTKQLMDNKWLSQEIINRLAASWAFSKMVDDIATTVCKIR